MKMLYTYQPEDSEDTTVTITYSSESSEFPSSNLKVISPVQCWRSTSVTDSDITYDAGSGNKFNVDSLFINRFNFASFKIEGNDTDVWTSPSFSVTISEQTTDEIAEENYMHYFYTFSPKFNYRFLRLFIPAQTPLFEPTYFKIGNLLIGNAIEVWNPKPGYRVDIIPKNSVVDYDSGAFNEYKVGRTKRSFNGSFDKISNTEYNKIVKTRDPFVLYHDWEADNTKAYLVKAVHNYNRSFDYYNYTSQTFQFAEIV